jgi:hypothetical protein
MLKPSHMNQEKTPLAFEVPDGREATGGLDLTVAEQHELGVAYFGMENSWIKLHRKILENWVFKQRPEYLKIWVYILIAANWKPSKALVNGQFVTIERGEMLTSYRSLAEGAGTTVQIVKTFLKYAENDGMISVKSNTAATRLKILNYEDLQGRENNDQHTPNTRLTHDQHTPNTIIRSKEYKEGKKERIEEVKEDSVSMRSRAFTRPSLQEILGYFIELGSTADEANKFFDHYTANGWKVGKNAMKDWKATARNWNRNSNNYNKPTGRTNGTGQKGDRGRYDSLEYANQLAQLGNRGLPDKPVKPTYLVGDSVPRLAPVTGYIDSSRTSGSDPDEAQ